MASKKKKNKSIKPIRISPVIREKMPGIYKNIKSFIKRSVQNFDKLFVYLSGKNKSEEEEEVGKIVSSQVRWGLYVLLALFLFFGVWSVLAPIDSAAIASGQVVLGDNRKTVQHLEGGIIDEILIKEGDKVEKGQVLIKLSKISAKARKDLIYGQLLISKAIEARLLAEREEKASVSYGDELIKNNNNVEIQNVINTQNRLFNTRRASLVGQVDVLNQRIEQFKEQVKGVIAQKKAANKQLKLINEEVAIVRRLLEQGHARKPRLLALERRAAELEGLIGEYTAQLARVKELIAEANLQKLNLKNDYFKEVEEELKDIQRETADLKEQLQAAEDVLKRTDVVAKQSGIVTGLRFHTVGGVVAPGNPILDIVPQDDKLLVEARVLPQDIDVVHEGLLAKVMLSAYKSRFVPRVDGRVVHVSADVFVDEATGDSFYKARVIIDREEIEKLSSDVSLYPGMPAEVFIVSGKRNFLGYLFSPILDSFRRAFKEQ